ncbi:hypothetical protein CcaverHIS002_0311990 [Cutaneotrichosporon cavernicola]|uniref:Pre-mRNA-processing factor 17 n=1 Tax=Cutaneotrichosporon cavernicola TaxID=279322 RepID=A0AA48L364_9TREE|nr:uncharacterized protein CcaverHIS019_0311850 [Cutaneotrichosporon cavernicola]BEI83331.1 hypothetical protein CcaverHIS002_0311990 [Cutaneotrichosporon cavernicola]BEI91115.1 hypothetical protein CcaverHIS019_0311850 [Cutaneotrichosporon cavernicola]BEI98892.1 hypothetical protein CcaverHIS631_0311910 [Cutaneotrichosporon cavernicola]BEJ06665.1 hypothetical protein CcaverHIS641_0311870 [Cutaneotrichosporon cavernicola]
MSALLAGYASSDDEDAPGPSTLKTTVSAVDDVDDNDDELEAQTREDAFGLSSVRQLKASKVATKLDVTSAPDVLAEDPNAVSNAVIARPTDQVVNVNLRYEDMTKPVQGPEDPFNQSKNKGMNSVAGHVEEQVMDTYEFERQKRTFDVHGYAYDPSVAGNGALIGSAETAATNGFNLIDTLRPSKAQRKAVKRKRAGKGDASVVDGVDAYMGPWAGYDEPKDEVAMAEEEEEEDEEWRIEKKRREDAKATAQEKMKQSTEEKSTFHGKELYDYAGRSYLHIPTDVDVKLNPTEGTPPPNAYVPDGNCIHTWTGHTKGVSAIRLFPRSGHLLLSGSMDTKIKLWDVYHEGNCLRTFMGHSQAVKDVAFDRKGERFLSSSYDRSVKLWDTETGKVISRFSTGKLANVVKFHPEADRQNIFLAGMQDKKILQWDIRSHEIVQTYDQHLGPVNTITFVDNNRRFMTTSDDKTIRGWDFDIPVVIKYIAEPYMHSMPSVAKHPGNKWVAAQSLDNQILVYSADGAFRQNKKKRFAGHTIAGYACAINFSPDGKYISSGTGGGDLVFWDWKTGRIEKRLRAHKQVVIDHCWLPNEHSKVITASWDGLIKLWA